MNFNTIATLVLAAVVGFLGFAVLQDTAPAEEEIGGYTRFTDLSFSNSLAVGTYGNEVELIDSSGNWEVYDDLDLGFGTDSPITLEWTTADANANCLILDMPAGSAVDVPGFGIVTTDADFGYFNGETQPFFFSEDDDGDSYWFIGWEDDDDPEITAGGSATAIAHNYDFILENDETLVNSTDGDVVLTGDDDTGIDFQIVASDHDTTGDASLTLDADAGGDNTDTWILESEANGNDFTINNHETEVFNLTSAGALQIDSTFSVDGGTIANATAAGTITLDCADQSAGSSKTYTAISGTVPAHTSNTPTSIFLDINPTVGIPTVANTVNLIDMCFTTPVYGTGVASTYRGIYFDPTIGAATAGTNNLVLFDVAAIGDGDANLNIYGARFGAMTQEGGETAHALDVGSGWDYGLVSASNIGLVGAAQLDLLIDNTTTGSDQDSGYLIFSGYDHDTTTDYDMSIFLDVETSTDYRLSFLPDGKGTEVASLDQGGNLQIDGDFDLDGGELDVATAATDVVIKSDTDAALEVYDGTTKIVEVDSRVTTDQMANVTLTGAPATFAAANGSTHRLLSLSPGTTTLTGSTGVTDMSGMGLYIGQPTQTDSSAVTVAKASTVYIAGEPAAGGSVTITAPYALEVASGNVLFAGSVQGASFIVDDGDADLTVDSDNQTHASAALTIPDFVDATADVLTTNTFTTILPFAGGMVGEDTDGTATNGGGMVGSTVDITTHDYNDGAAGDNDVLCKVYDKTSTTWDDLSTSALLSAGADWTANYQLLPDADAEEADDAFAIGFDEQFCYVAFNDLATGTGAMATWGGAGGKWQYSDGASSWADLTVFDNTSTGATTGTQTLQRTGTITFAPPSDWVVRTIDGEEAYWIQYVITDAQLTQTPLIDSTNKDEPIIGIPTTDSWQAPYKCEIVDVRVTDMGATVHDQIIKFVVANFTDGTFSAELSWAASQFNDKFALATAIACDADDIVGILITDDAGATNNPTWAVEFEVTYED